MKNVFGKIKFIFGKKNFLIHHVSILVSSYRPIKILLSKFSATLVNCVSMSNVEEEEKGLKKKSSFSFDKHFLPQILGFKKKEQHLNWTFKEFEFLQTLGQGNFGKVKAVRHIPTQKEYAAKILYKKDLVKIITKVKDEILALQEIKSNFVVKLYKVFEDTNKLYIIQDLIPGGDLLRLLEAREGYLNEKEAKFYFVEILLGLQDAHKYNILYRDLKPENILLEKSGHVKLCDFGLCKKLKKGEKTYTICGSVEYESPEILLKTGHDISSDYWALGVVLYKMLVGTTPFFDTNLQKMEENIIKLEIKLPNNLSKEVQGLLMMLLERDDKKRLSNVQKIRKHPWLSDIDWKLAENSQLLPPLSIDDIELFEDRKKSKLPLPLTETEKKVFSELAKMCNIESDK